MKKFIKNISYLLIALIALSACQSVKDGLTGKKKTNADEFLVEKKNPLVLPPQFNELPQPTSLIVESKNQEEVDLRSIISKKSSVTKKLSTDKVKDSSLEKKILENIRKN